ncbi:MAG: helix-turn-helix transcriptional regulator, partial [Desulfobulbales bacterium]|nr:helix-turn-helix transcriptional regulator [Desulfobulbales bacterium]
LKLTSAEIQVANFIKSGKTTKEIANILNLSERTIETHRKNIRNKMGLKQKKISLRSSLLALK